DSRNDEACGFVAHDQLRTQRAITAADLHGELRGIRVDELATETGRERALIIEAAEAIVFVASGAEPEPALVASERLVHLQASIHMLGRRNALALAVEPGRLERVLPALELADHLNLGVARFS